jgi:LDH2 family malate/lactate/ureidoglycolate dehydrogenase
MSEEPIDPTTALPGKRQRANQDRAVANGITLAEQQLDVCSVR